jgi:hypothetical protein
MAVLLKPNGLFGTAYMAAIRRFRHVIVYPPILARDRAALAGGHSLGIVARRRDVTLPPANGDTMIGTSGR